MHTVAIIQARTGSTRLPGKVMEDLGGRPMLSRQLERLRRSQRLDGIVIATTTAPSDSVLVELADKEGLPCHRGSEDDVLSRFVGAATVSRADIIVRLTGDCPLADPGVIDRIVQDIQEHSSECDYSSNMTTRSYPRGLDAEAFFMDTLMRLDRYSTAQQDREHVTSQLRADQSGMYRLRDVVDEGDNSPHRWTVDTPEDLAFVRRIFGELKMGERFVGYQEILAHLAQHPEQALLDEAGHTWDPIAGKQA